MISFGAFKDVRIGPFLNILLAIWTEYSEHATKLTKFIHGVREYLTLSQDHLFHGDQIAIEEFMGSKLNRGVCVAQACQFDLGENLRNIAGARRTILIYFQSILGLP